MSIEKRLDELEKHVWPASVRYVFVPDGDPSKQEQIDAARAELHDGETLQVVTFSGGFRGLGKDVT